MKFANPIAPTATARYRTWRVRGSRFLGALGLGLGLILGGCRVPERPLEPEANLEATQQLTFQSLSLQQAEPDGTVLWKLRAEQAVADPKTRRVQVQRLVGELYDQGKPRYRVEAAQATVLEQGNELDVQGQIVATDVRDQTRITTQEMLWRPQQQELHLKGGVELRQPKIQLKAQEAIVRVRDNHLALRNQVRVTNQKPALNITGESLDWQWQTGLVQAMQPVQIIYTPQQLVVNAGQGQMDFQNQVLRLTQGVNAVNPRGRLQAQEVEWRLSTQDVTAIGNVIYRQNDPPMTVTGTRADGNLGTRQIRVEGASTKFVP